MSILIGLKKLEYKVMDRNFGKICKTLDRQINHEMFAENTTYKRGDSFWCWINNC